MKSRRTTSLRYKLGVVVGLVIKFGPLIAAACFAASELCSVADVCLSFEKVAATVAVPVGLAYGWCSLLGHRSDRELRELRRHVAL